MVSPHHKISLSSGRFKNTTREQLTTAFDVFTNSTQRNTLVLHFHGGLVSEEAAELIAERLMPVYQNAGGYPLFIMWQSGLSETIKNNWEEIVKENVFSALVKRVLQFVIGKLDQKPGERGVQDVELPSRFEIEDEIQKKQAVGKEPFADRNTEATSLDSELMSTEQEQFKALLESDPALANAQLIRDDAPKLSPLLEAELEAKLAETRAAEDLGERGLISTTVLVGAGIRILSRALRRFAKGSDHGIYTTVVEEVVRELKGDRIGGMVWKHMKKDTADSFDGEAGIHGGSALLEEIAQRWQQGHKPRIILVGHSTGAIYIAYFLQKAAKILPKDIRFEIIFLAPACSFQLLDQTLVTAGDRIAIFRSFGMDDEIEKQDAIFPPLYPRSLLYFVSGVLEETVDLPLVGMKRYHGGQAPFDGPDITRVCDELVGFPNAWIWSESQQGEGLSTIARKHGDFDNDELTLKSIAHLITTVI
jgi:hypothetical protein